MNTEHTILIGKGQDQPARNKSLLNIGDQLFTLWMEGGIVELVNNNTSKRAIIGEWLPDKGLYTINETESGLRIADVIKY